MSHQHIRRRSIVSFVGVSEHGHCGYCKSAKQPKAKAKFEEEEEHGDELSTDEKTKVGTKCPSAEEKCQKETEDDEAEQGSSVVFGLIAHCLSLHSFQQLLDLGWSLWAHQLTVQAYQSLADHGWRRSGRYLYKPLMERTCCPQYTIRLDVHRFRLSRTQKRVLRTMRQFLREDQRPREKEVIREEEQRSAGQNQQMTGKRAEKKGIDTRADGAAKQKNERDNSSKAERQPKKKQIRRQRAEERLKSRGVDLEQYKRDRADREAARRRTLQSYLDECNWDAANDTKKWAHKLELRLVGQPSPELDADFEEEYQLFRRYQMRVHGESGDDLSENSFRRFLAASPLIAEEEEEEEEEHDNDPKLPHLGSYHQQYRLDGRLVAVAVVDVLPRCLSAKYFFYDPDFAFLSLGTYSALREIAFTQQLAARRPALHYYYMGFYLFDCPKMRYKGRFRPSELLCDRCFEWVPLAEGDRLIGEADGTFTTFHPGREPPSEAMDALLADWSRLDQIRCISAERELLTVGQQRQRLMAYRQIVAEGEDPDPEAQEAADARRAELERKVLTYVRHAGPAALDMVLVL